MLKARIVTEARKLAIALHEPEVYRWFDFLSTLRIECTFICWTDNEELFIFLKMHDFLSIVSGLGDEAVHLIAISLYRQKITHLNIFVIIVVYSCPT
ncbi:MAG: hypothetical protein KME60_17315 [Cyanomargarita calcarea GSE-NOS-MK-12-04C]|uniref:Uncharacterized protein n=1 Tax=Cyanomargarita calcarea GSE-NOS-MK-12-04C TaxID=2839659 RepID=A0A951UTU3_9CYAN|nr:hypothetical protein [Cyanomargarita calcarea GSE-NOS-MK-12-04C]